MNSSDLSRRSFLRAGSAAMVAGTWSTLTWSGSSGGAAERMVLVILRGGLDGLYAVPAVGDPDFATARGTLAQYASPTLPLQGIFALHPALTQLHDMYGKGEACIVHAVGLPYHERSHFDAQQVLESGGAQPYELKDGWLGRAIASRAQKGMAINTAVPLVLRGSREVDTWAPSRLPDPSSDLLQRVERMYERDPALSAALQRARQLREDPAMTDAGGTRQGVNGFVALCHQTAEFLRQPKGPQVAVLELGGWDSHADQANPSGKISENLRQLDAGLATLRTRLSAPDAEGAWQRTVVVVATEFGRTVEMNGTRGTDHGNGGAAFVLGGKVKGGRVIADWPGLAKSQRFEGRDLKTTTDLRSVFKGILEDHLKATSGQAPVAIFPDSAAAPSIRLMRT